MLTKVYFCMLAARFRCLLCGEVSSQEFRLTLNAQVVSMIDSLFGRCSRKGNGLFFHGENETAPLTSQQIGFSVSLMG